MYTCSKKEGDRAECCEMCIPSFCNFEINESPIFEGDSPCISSTLQVSHFSIVVNRFHDLKLLFFHDYLKQGSLRAEYRSIMQANEEELARQRRANR